jgi:hypothetical protein
MKPKRATAIRILLAKKKEHNDNSKDGVLMIEIREDYYSSRRYEISDSYYFDNRRAPLFDS